MPTDTLRRYLITPNKAAVLNSHFELLLDGCHIGSIRATATRIGVQKKMSGCYVWLMRVGDDRYAIYVGRTNCISRRISDYSAGFQVQSPNDFKMRLVEEALRQRFPSAAFDLLFTHVPEEACAAKEIELIALFKPLVNSLSKPSDELKTAIENVYRVHYHAAIARHFEDGT